MADNWRVWIAKRLLGSSVVEQLTAVTAKVDDSPGWGNLSDRPHDRTWSEIQSLYEDALTAWRKNPIAWRIISITTDYIVGNKIRINSPRRDLQRFIERFWNHPKNRLDLRLDMMSDELSRAGDLFPVLFRNEMNGESYIRFVTKDRIIKIDTASNDWETELAYHELQVDGEEKIWFSPANPKAEKADAIMLHYSVNKPIGAILGESDLTTMLPWLQRYSRMLEDRVRMHWAVRSFLWIVTVPANKVKAKMEQYRQPPDAGSIIVKDESETWEAASPLLRASDASHDLQAVRQMVDAGSGYPPHWRGESGDANLATATAMQSPTERHLLRRQQYFIYMLQDIIYNAYQRAVQVAKARKIKDADYDLLFLTAAPDVSRSDNEALAKASRDLAETFKTLSGDLVMSEQPTLAKLLLRMIFKFSGEPQNDEVLESILSEAKAKPKPAAPAEPTEDSNDSNDN